MITNLEIKNFKSIKNLKLNCSRVNLFIGAPNTGKSNILESIGILSYGYTSRLEDFVRYKNISNLFYFNEINKKIAIDYYIDKDSTIHEWDTTASNVNFKHKILIEYNDKNIFDIQSIGDDFMNCNFKAHFDIKENRFLGSVYSYEPFVRYFRFRNIELDKVDNIYTLKPPNGKNITNIINSNNIVKEFVSNLLSEFNYKIILDELTGNIDFLAERNNVISKIPFELLSDTLVKIILLFSAIETSKHHTIVLEEPEAHVFPFYNKFLAERIALYNTNQFFIATHNPTFLANIIEQTPDNELKVFVTYYENYQTKVLELSGEKLLKSYKIFGTEIFGNLDKIVKNLDKIIEKEELEAN